MSRTAQEKRVLELETYHILEDTFVGKIFLNKVTDVMWQISAYNMVYEIKYLIHGEGVLGSFELARQNGRQNLTEFYQGIVEAAYNMCYWNTDKMKSTYMGTLAEFEKNPIKTIVSPPATRFITGGEIVPTMIEIGDIMLNGTDKELGRYMENRVGEIGITVASALIMKGIGKGISKLVPQIKTAINKSRSVAGMADDVIEGGDNPNTTRVGRRMSQAEYDKMIETGKVQMSGDNKVHVANPADIEAFGKQAPKGSIYVEFDVPSNTISTDGTDGWGIINGPGSLLDRLNAKKGLPRITEMPNATNIEVKGSK